MVVGEEGPSNQGLRVGLVVSDFPVLSETFVAMLAEDLLTRGLDVRIVACDQPERRPVRVHDFVRDSNLLDRVSYSSSRSRLLASQVMELARASPRKSLRLAGAWLADIVVPGRAFAMARHFAELGTFDVVHCQFAPLGLRALRSRKLGALRTRALIVHIRGYDMTSFVRQRGAAVYRALFTEADLFIASCEYLRQRAIDLGCPAEKCVVVGSPIDTHRFVPAEADMCQRDDRHLHLVAVGRLVEKKGFADAIAAVACLRASGRDVQLRILGEGPERHALEEQISRLGLTSQVSLDGACTQEEVISALWQADIGLAPSVTAADGDQEGIVNALKEMMATGLPVVATRHGGTPELVTDGINGFLVPEHDPAALSDKIAWLADNRGVWKSMGNAGRQAILEKFSRRRAAERTLLYYEEQLLYCK